MWLQIEKLNNWHNKTMKRYDLVINELNCKTEITNLKIENAKFKKKKNNYVKKVQITSCCKDFRYRKEHSQFKKAYLNNPIRWGELRKITIHSNSKEIASNSTMYLFFNLGFCFIGGQTPNLVKTKKNITNKSFRIIKNLPFGLISSLRGSRLSYFCYKWSFMVSSLSKEKLKSSRKATINESIGIGINDWLIFKELGEKDYYAFEKLPGLELAFDHIRSIKSIKHLIED